MLEPTRGIQSAPAHLLFVGDFSASRLGNYSVAEDLARRLADSGLDVATTSARRYRVFKFADMMLQSLFTPRSPGAAVVDVYSGRAFVWAEAVCAVLRSRGVPYALVLRGGNLPAFASRYGGRVSRLFRTAGAVVALSRYLEEQMAPYANEVQTIPNPLDIGRYEFRPRRELRSRLVWLRGFHETYNPALVPRVLARLADEVPDVTVAMVGADKKDGSLKRTKRVATELGVSDRIDYVGPVEKAEVGEWLQSGDVFLNTPRIDNVPISVLEAMACGLCVVSTAVGGIPYLLKDGENALLAPNGDDLGLSAAIARCFRDPELAESLSYGGRRSAERYDWSQVFPRWLVLLRTLAEGAKGSA